MNPAASRQGIEPSTGMNVIQREQLRLTYHRPFQSAESQNNPQMLVGDDLKNLRNFQVFVSENITQVTINMGYISTLHDCQIRKLDEHSTNFRVNTK